VTNDYQSRGTLFDAFRAAQSAGVSTSPLEQAMFGFNQTVPRSDDPFSLAAGQPSPQRATPTGAPSGFMQPQQSDPYGLAAQGQPGQMGDGGGFMSGLGSAVAPLFSGAALLDTLLPGTPGSAAKEQIARVPIAGRVLAETIDGLFSPASALVALRGAQIAAKAAQLGPMGKFAGAFLRPISETQSLSRRFAVEGSAILGGVTLNRMSEHLPMPFQIAATLGGALVGARIGVRKFGDLNDAANQAAVLRRLHPTGEMVELNRVQGVIDNLDEKQLLAADDLSRELQSKLLETSGLGINSFPSGVDFEKNAGELMKLWGMNERQFLDVQNMLDLTSKRLVSRIPPSLLDDVDIKQGTMWENVARILDGQKNRDPWGRVLADAMSSYVRSGTQAASVFESIAQGERQGLFGNMMEKLKIRRAIVPDEVDVRSRELLTRERKVLDYRLRDDRIRFKKQMAARHGLKLSDDQIELILNGIGDPSLSAAAIRDIEAWAARMAPMHNRMRSATNDLANLTRRIDGGAEAGEELLKAQRLLGMMRDGATSAAPNQRIASGPLLAMAYEKPYLFDLTPEQVNFFDRLRQLESVDSVLNKAFGVDVDHITNVNYVRHYSDLKTFGPDGKLHDVTIESAAKLFREAGIDLQKGFQMPRTFSSMLDWLDATTRYRNPKEWNDNINSIIERVRTAGGKDWEDEVRRLTELRTANLVPMPREMDFETMFSSRIVEGYQARAEHLGKNLASAAGPEALAEVTKYLVPQHITPLVTAPAGVASVLRGALLRADLSVFGVQIANSLGALWGPNAALRESSRQVMHFAKDPQAFNKWAVLNAAEISQAMNAGLVLSPRDISMITEGTRSDPILRPFMVGKKDIVDPATGEAMKITGVQAKTAGVPLPVVSQFQSFVRATDEIQFGRVIPFLKLQAYKTMTTSLKAAGQHDSFMESLVRLRPFTHMKRADLSKMSEFELQKMSAEFINDLFGGRNHVDLGRGRVGQLLESIFMLTPGFTRGTLHTTMKAMGQGPEAALARDLLLRWAALAGGLITLTTVGANGIGGVLSGEGPGVVMPNLFDPTKSDWMDVKLPGGRAIRPMARFRGLARIALGSVQEAAINGNLTEAGKYWSDDTLRWLSYRQSGLVQSVFGDPVGDVLGEQRGNSFARNTGVLDLIRNPSTSRADDIAEALTARVPIFAQQIIEAQKAHGMTLRGFREGTTSIASQLFGVGTFGPTSLESSVAARSAELAIAAGLDPDIAYDMARRGQTPLNARDSDGRYLLNNEQRREVAETIAEEFGISTELAYRGGRINERQRAAETKAIEQAQVGQFMTALNTITTEYETRRIMLEDALARGAIDHNTYSQELTKLRLQRAGARLGAEAATPYATIFLGDASRLSSQNYRDALYASIAAESFETDFIDPLTGTFDFAAYQEQQEMLSDKYGPAYDAWLEHRDRNKSAVELERDRGIRTLGPYFQVSDLAWQMVTQGQFGQSETELNQHLDKMLLDQGLDPGIVQAMREQIKSQLPFMSEYRSLANSFRDMTRASDPAIERAAVKWLGNTPLVLRR